MRSKAKDKMRSLKNIVCSSIRDNAFFSSESPRTPKTRSHDPSHSKKVSGELKVHCCFVCVFFLFVRVCLDDAAFLILPVHRVCPPPRKVCTIHRWPSPGQQRIHLMFPSRTVSSITQLRRLRKDAEKQTSVLLSRNLKIKCQYIYLYSIGRIWFAHVYKLVALYKEWWFVNQYMWTSFRSTKNI